ncbi:MAG: PDZ domain-containing protein [Acidobacteriota bacterium]
MKRISFFMGTLLTLYSPLFAIQEVRLLRQPNTNGAEIVFVYGGDLWTVPINGGEARRLTAHPGMESSPKYSPDGKYIAFTGHYDGNMDVFVIPALGGDPRRLTYHPDNDLVEGWTPNGEKILFRSTRYSYSRFSRLFAVDSAGGFPKPLPMPMAEMGSFSPDGTHIAYTPLRNAFDTWKKYKGGRTTPIWVFNLKDFSYMEIPHENASDTFPMWIGETIYFLSDRNGTMNLFSYDLKSKKVNQVTNHETFDIKWASEGGGIIVYECEGYIYTFNPSSGKLKKISISVSSDLIDTRPRFIKVAEQIRNFDLSPTGVRVTFEAHGEILTVPAKKGDIRNLTEEPGSCERYPSWSPDGQSIAYLSDTSGEYKLYIIDQKGEKDPIQIKLGKTAFYYSPIWSPDGKKIAYTDNQLNLYYLDLSKKKPILIDIDTYSAPERSMDPVWSPDSKWIAYAKRLDNHFRAIFLYSLENYKKFQITDGMSDAIFPTFDKNCKYLYFSASTDAGPSIAWLDLSSYNQRFTRNIYVVVLRKDLPSPFAPESDEEKKEEKPEKKEEKKSEKKPESSKEEKVEFRIDLENIDQRILALPVPARQYSQLLTATDEILFYLVYKPDSRDYTLYRFDMKERKDEVFLENLNGYDISHDGKKLLYVSKKTWGIVDTSGKVKVGDGKINTEGMEVRIDPKAEWKQMFDEAWRINRDFFYDPNMHGVDWVMIKERYSKFLPYVAHRSDLTYLIGEMIGELHVGHAYVGGGEYPKVKVVPVGLLGADYEIINDRYRIKKIYSGLNWNPDLRAPLTEPGVNVNVGDYILRVNGRELKFPTNIYSLFEKAAGKQVILTVNSKPEEEGSRTVTVVPIESEMALRNRDWVEGNLKKVEKLSNGKAGYVYLPNTSVAGYTYFNRYFFAQLGKEALVIDERFNGGGYAADYIIDMLDRPLLNCWATRDGKDFTTPVGSIFGPKVMIINEYAGSGGDALPLYFKRRNLGKLVGKRTWGGLIGIYDYPSLMDGGFVTSPRVAIWNPKGEWEVENIGVFPDIEVEMSPAEVISGSDPQLEKAVQVALEELNKNPLPKLNRPSYPVKK